MSSLDDSSARVPLHLNRQLDTLCDAFERQLSAGEEPDFAAYLQQIEPDGRSHLLAEIVALAADRLRSQGVSDPAATLIARNPHLRDEVRSVLDGLSDDKATAAFEPPKAPNVSPVLTPRRKKSRGLHIRCPHCSNHVELVGDTPLDSVDCTTCGSNFSLVDRSKETRMAEALQKIDRFELISRLGVGGFGTVWKARDTDLDRAVAVKIPRHGQLSVEEMEQFFREARSVAQLRHPNIIPVHEVGREGDAVFIVSDLIRGVSLADLLTGKRMTPREAAELGVTVGKALDHAHRRGVIHRDLKPSNVMIDDDGTPYLMDFGLAKREADEVTMTMDGQIIGTPAYMSPEQADGRSAWADRRTDVYALGVILFELLTGELPFRGNAQMQVRTRLNEDAPNARALNRHLPLDLATICAKCLEREPGRRYQSAAEVAAELQRFLNREPIKARPLSPVGRALRWANRRPLSATLAALVAVLAIVGPTVAVVIERQRSQLEKKNTENTNLIIAREAENVDAMRKVAELEAKLDTWEGRANPWELWPPEPGAPLARQQLTSLLSARGASLRDATEGDSAEASAVGSLALATLYDSLGRNKDALLCYQDAAASLSKMLRVRPDDVRVGMALAESYDRLSTLAAEDSREESLEWMKKGIEIRRRLANAAPSNPVVQALLLETEVRSGAAAGFERGAEQLIEATELNTRLKELWPSRPAELYRLACLLTGRTAWLATTSEDPEAFTVERP